MSKSERKKSVAEEAAEAYERAYDAKMAELESGSGKQKHLAPEIAAAKAGQAAAKAVRERRENEDGSKKEAPRRHKPFAEGR